MFTIWAVDSQEGQEVTDPTSQVHKPPRQIHLPQGLLRLNWRELLFEEAGRIMPQDEGVISTKLDQISMRGDRQESRRHNTH